MIMRAALLLAPAVAFLRAPARQPTLPRSSTTSSEPTTSELADATALSDSFDGAVQDASRGLLKSIGDGNRMLRLDFDTSMGDATYTQLKLSLDFARDVAVEWALELEEDETLCLFFPDAGAAALAKKDWKLDDLDEALVPPNVRLAGFPRDKLEKGDAAVFALCPRAPERDACEALVLDCGEKNLPIALLNPELVDMGTTGYGMAGRMFKERLLDKLAPCYYLRTLDWGALARTYPQRYTVWQEDSTVPDGYRFLRNFDRQPNSEELEDLYFECNPVEGEGDPVAGLFDGLGKFIDAFGKM